MVHRCSPDRDAKAPESVNFPEHASAYVDDKSVTCLLVSR